MQVLNDHLFSRPDRVLTHRHDCPERADLYVLAVIFNPIRYRSRWKLYQDFARRVKHSGAKLYVAEIAFGHRDFVIGQDDPVAPDYVLQLATETELWMKEAALKLLTARLPIAAQYLAYMDADVGLVRDDWANEVVQGLQHYDVLQPWSEAEDLGPDHTTIARHHSFVYSWMHGEPMPPGHGYYGPPGSPGSDVHFWHPGFMWAWRRAALDAVGGLLTHGILGAGDNHMAKGLIGDAESSIHPDMGEAYRRRVEQWQHHALVHIKKNIGYIPGKLFHYWHGAKAKRLYWDRWKILVETQFSPDTDLKDDWQGLPQLVVDEPRQQRLRDLIREYFRARDEDATTN